MAVVVANAVVVDVTMVEVVEVVEVTMVVAVVVVDVAEGGTTRYDTYIAMRAAADASAGNH